MANPKEKYDVIVIGSGLGGLESALILAKEGLSVCVLEKNKQVGGNLQTFSRDKVIFDTGVHYIGALDKGQNLHQIFHYLGIMDDLKISRMDMEAFDVVGLQDQKDHPLAQSYELFKQSLIDQFPKEKDGIQKYCEHVIAACDSFPLYRLIPEKENVFENKYVTSNARAVIQSLTTDVTLQNVLAGNNFLYEGIGSSTPFFVHALVVNSYIESSWRMINGGSQISLLLQKQLRNNGAEVYIKKEVTHILSQREVKGVKLASGEQIRAKYVISNVHPSMTLDLIDDKKIKPAYRNRIKGLDNTLSAFSLHLVLNDDKIPYFNCNYYDFHCEDVWNSTHTKKNWPGITMISTSPSKEMQKYADNISVMTYMHADEFKNWKGSFNTTLKSEDRGDEYESLKEEKMETIIQKLERRFPEIRAAIKSKHASTPLTYRDYIASADGSMYGVRRDYRYPERSFIGPKTSIKNLFLTGQNLSHLHGILGVSIAAISTCSEILGMEYLIKNVKQP